MRDVYVLGAGMTKFGMHMDRDVRSLCEEALFEAMKDAEVRPGDIEIGFLGTVGMSPDTPMMIAQIAFEQVGVRGIPLTRTENACGSGANAIYLAWLAIQSGLYDVALVCGMEKMNGPRVAQVREFSHLGGGDAMMEGDMGFFPPGIFAMIAQRMMEEGIFTREQLAMVAVKNSHHAVGNEKAQRPRPVTVEQVVNAKLVAAPLTVLDCCPLTDGAAAVVLGSEEALEKFGSRAVRIKGIHQVSGSYCEDDPSMTPDTTRRAVARTYEMAGVGPEDVDFVECHDCFTMAELGHYSDLGFCKPEEIGKYIEEKKPWRDGPKDGTPFNVSGGLMNKGHPLGATGPAQYYEAMLQLRDRAGSRQVKGAKVGLLHNGGGFRHGDTGIVLTSILEKVQ